MHGVTGSPSPFKRGTKILWHHPISPFLACMMVRTTQRFWPPRGGVGGGGGVGVRDCTWVPPVVAGHDAIDGDVMVDVHVRHLHQDVLLISESLGLVAPILCTFFNGWCVGGRGGWLSTELDWGVFVDSDWHQYPSIAPP